MGNMRPSRSNPTKVMVALSVLAMLLACGSRGLSDDAANDVSFAVVPDLVGDTMDTVYDQLQDADLVASATNGYGGSDWDEDWVVIATDPKAGTQVEPGSTVEILEASKGEIVFYAKPMPDLRGTNWLDAAGGVTEAVYPYISFTWRKPKGREKPGTVVSQTPRAGATMKLGTPIVLTVVDYKAGDLGSGWDGYDGFDIDGPNICRHTRWC